MLCRNPTKVRVALVVLAWPISQRALPSSQTVAICLRLPSLGYDRLTSSEGLPMMDYMFANPAHPAVAPGEHALSHQEQFSLRPRAASATPSRASDMQSSTGLTAQPSAQYPFGGSFVAYETDVSSQAGIPLAAPYQFGDAMPGFPTTSDFAQTAYPG